MIIFLTHIRKTVSYTQEPMTTTRLWDGSILRLRKYAKEYLRLTKEEGYNWGMLKAVWGSVGNMAIVPIQDVLGIGSKGRMNMPSTLGTNWKWRALDGDMNAALARKIYKNMQIYCRLRKPEEEAAEE